MPCQLKIISRNFPAKRFVFFHPPKQKSIYYIHVYPKQSKFFSLKKLGMFFPKNTWAGNVGLCLLFYYLTMLGYEYEALGTNLKICTRTQNQKNTPARC